MKKVSYSILSAVVVASLLTACGANGTGSSNSGGNQQASATANKAPAPTMDNSPITLSIFQDFTEPQVLIDDHIIAPIKKKFPNVTLNIVKKAKGTTVDDLVASGQFPDIILSSTGWITRTYAKVNLTYDLTPLIKKYKMDMSQYDPVVMGAIKQQADKGEIYALPFYNNSMVLSYYNKDIFDKLAVPYPKDGMTWDDYLDLQKRMTRTVDGVQYQAMDPATLTFGHPGYDFFKPGTDTPDLLNDKWVEHFKLFAQFYQLPGTSYTTPGKDKNWTDQFFKDRTTAVFAYRDYISYFQDLEKSGKPMNWDMATYPTFKDAPGIGLGVDSHNFMISPTSKHKDEAFQVIQYLVSPEAQLEMAKDGKISPLVGQTYKDNFGKNLPILKGKNIAAIFKTKPAPATKVNQYFDLVNNEVVKAAGEMKNGNTDVVTLLRAANDAATKAIAAAKH